MSFAQANRGGKLRVLEGERVRLRPVEDRYPATDGVGEGCGHSPLGRQEVRDG